MVGVATLFVGLSAGAFRFSVGERPVVDDPETACRDCEQAIELIAGRRRELQQEVQALRTEIERLGNEQLGPVGHSAESGHGKTDSEAHPLGQEWLEELEPEVRAEALLYFLRIKASLRRLERSPTDSEGGMPPDFRESVIRERRAAIVALKEVRSVEELEAWIDEYGGNVE